MNASQSGVLGLADLVLAGMTPAQLCDRLDAALAKRRLAPFAKAAYAVRYPGQRLVWSWFHDCICEHLEACTMGQMRRLLINVPPRSLKSFLVSVAWPSWWWTREPNKQFMFTSADEKVVYRDADAMRDLCGSEWYRGWFKPEWGFDVQSGTRKQDAKGYYRNTAGGHRISMPIGTKSQGLDADVIGVDDPLDAESAYNDKAALVTHIINLRQKFMTRHNDPQTGVIVGVMQRLHELDFTGVMLDDGGWEHVCLPAEFDGEHRYTSLGQYDQRTEQGELLDPVRMPKDFLEGAERSLGPRGYAGQYLQRPAAARGAIVHKGWLLFWTPETIPQMDFIIGSWDLTKGSQTTDADWVVGQVWGVSGLNRYLLDQIRMKLAPHEMLDAVREMALRYPDLRAIVIEEKAAGKDVADTLRMEMSGIETYDPQDKSKEQRLAATVLLWRDGNVWLPDPFACSSVDCDYSWVRDHYVPELVTFPGSAHDDQVDATSQALLWLRENGPVSVRETVKALE